MNALGFFLGRLAWQFGIKLERARWTAVTRETQFLSQAQDLLGKLAWPNVSNIDDLTGEYWQLKDLHDQQKVLCDEHDTLTDSIEATKDRLGRIEQVYEDMVEGLRFRKSKIMERAAGLTEEMDVIKDEDQATRRKYASLKNKLDVLRKQDGDFSAEIAKTLAALEELKGHHDESKQRLERTEQEVQGMEVEVQAVDADIQAKRKEMRDESAGLVTEIGHMSKRVADLSAKIGQLENSKSELSFHIGQYLSNNTDSRNPGIVEALRPFRPLVSKITHLRKSIQYNQRLARRQSR